MGLIPELLYISEPGEGVEHGIRKNERNKVHMTKKKSRDMSDRKEDDPQKHEQEKRRTSQI